MKTYHYSHPDWDMTLIVTGDDHRKKAEDMLSCDEGDPDQLVCAEIEMTQEEIDALPEFDG
ncbi:MAG: hypothetical protein ACOX0Y_03195 [Thiopseudomonas sp.]